MASLYTIRGSGGHPDVQVICSKLKEEEFVLVASHFHQTPVEWELPLSPMVLGYDNMKTIIPSALYATGVLSILPFQAADETDKTKTTFKVDTAELDKITLVVEREFRGVDIHTTTADDYTFRANIYPHFTNSEEKASIDDSDSAHVLIRGPWTRNAYAAIAELNNLVVPTFRKKLETLDVDDSVRAELAANKSYRELKLSAGELVVQWAGVNIRAVSKEENSKKPATASFSGGELPSATLIPTVHSTSSSNDLFSFGGETKVCGNFFSS